MRRSREDVEPPTERASDVTAPSNIAAGSGSAADGDRAATLHPPTIIAHPSRYFVPYTGRYYVHFVLRDAKGFAGHSLRYLVHSNGLCVLCLDLSNILVVSHFNLRRSERSHQQQQQCRPANDGGARVPPIFERIQYCDAFPPSTSTSKAAAPGRCPGASSAAALTCNTAADLYRMVCDGVVALSTTSVSHTVNGTRGVRNRLDAAASLGGRRKRNATYMQDETTVVSFNVDTLVRCPTCDHWQVVPMPVSEKQIRATAAAAAAAAAATSAAAAVVAAPAESDAATTVTATSAAAMALIEPSYVGCAMTVAGGAGFHLPRSVKVPIGVNSVLMELNELVATDFEAALEAPLTTGFIAIMQPRADVSFSARCERASNTSPMVSPSDAVRPFVADAFTGTDF